MRSKIGIKSRLAAHILALILLIVVLVYLAPSHDRRPAIAATATTSIEPAAPPTAAQPFAIPAESAAAMPAAMPAASDEPSPATVALADDDGATASVAPAAPVAAPIASPEQPPSAPPAEMPVESEKPAATPAADDAPAAPAAPTAPPPESPAEPQPEEAAVPADPGREPAEPVQTAEPAENGATLALPPAGTETGAAATPAEQPPHPADSDPSAAPESPSAGDDSMPSAPVQPDESGSLVVATADTGTAQRATTPLGSASLEVLGDGVYWLGPRHDLEKELAAISGLSDLVILAPLPGYKVHGFEHVLRDVIPADTDDLSSEAAERFLYVTQDRAKARASGNAARPVVVVAAVHGARGAAFFKGVYLLFNSNLSFDEIEKRIGPELEEAGPARDEILHRLRSLNDR